MSNTIYFVRPPALTLDYWIWESLAGTVWNGTGLVAFVTANWATYDVATADSPADSHRVPLVAPATLPTGTYRVSGYNKAGASPDIDDLPIAQEWLVRWDGTNLYDLTEWLRAALVGSGARTVTITIDDGAVPLESAKVRVTKGAESYVQATNVSGVCVFNLDDGSWSVAVTLTGYTYAGTTLVVDGDENPTYSIAAVSVPASDPGLVTGFLYCYDEEGEPEAGVVVYAKLMELPGTGYSPDTKVRSATSDAEGLVTFTNMFPGSVYRMRRGKYRLWTEVDVSAGAASPYALPNLPGEDT